MTLEGGSARAFLDLAIALARAIPTMLLDPGYALLFWIVTILMSTQYRRVALTEQKLHGTVKNDVARQVASSVAYGLAGGLMGSAIMLMIGVSINQAGVVYLWPIALLLFLFAPRLMCFAYAGGLVSISSLTLGWPKVHVPGLMGLVAVLHIVESFLIRISGATCSTPLLVSKKHGGVVPGHSLQKYWPLPIMVLVTLSLADSSQLGDVIAMPDWWPLIRPEIEAPEGTQLLYAMIPVVAGLGYGDLAVTMHPRRKSATTARSLCLYSVTLLGLSIASSRIPSLAFLAAVFAPIGHELVVRAGIRSEMEGEPWLKWSGAGATVLDVFPGSEASRAGFRPGDVIAAVDGVSVSRREDAVRAIEDAVRWRNAREESPWGLSFPISIDVRRGRETTTIRIRPRHERSDMGLVLLPDPGEGGTVSIERAAPIGRLWRKLAGSRKRDSR